MKIRQNNNNDNDDDKKIKEKGCKQRLENLMLFIVSVINLSIDGIISDLGVEFVSSFTDIRFSSCSL